MRTRSRAFSAARRLSPGYAWTSALTPSDRWFAWVPIAGRDCRRARRHRGRTEPQRLDRKTNEAGELAASQRSDSCSNPGPNCRAGDGISTRALQDRRIPHKGSWEPLQDCVVRRSRITQPWVRFYKDWSRGPRSAEDRRYRDAGRSDPGGRCMRLLMIASTSGAAARGRVLGRPSGRRGLGLSRVLARTMSPPAWRSYRQGRRQLCLYDP
jgi:hypothetical protein